MNLENAINQGTKILEKNLIQSAKLDSEILMSKVICKEREFIILNQKNHLERNSYDYFKRLIKQRSKGKPIAYLTGKKDFWKYEFKIDKNVLVPRPDTEIIIPTITPI